jgi:hypothetical protein
MSKPLETKVKDTRLIRDIPADMCINHFIAREQRKHEKDIGLGLKGTKSFEDKGCYKCDGYNYECDRYQPNKKE